VTKITAGTRSCSVGRECVARPERYLLATLLVAGKELLARERHGIQGAHLKAHHQRCLRQGRERQQRRECESDDAYDVILRLSYRGKPSTAKVRNFAYLLPILRTSLNSAELR